MDEGERLMIERACERLVLRYCHLIDHGEAARVVELFSEDGVWASPEATRTGRAEIARAFQARQDNAGRISRHVCSTCLIEVTGENEAEGLTYIILYRHDGEPGRRFGALGLPEAVGDYRDRFVRTPAGWRFARREFVPAFLPPRTAAQ